MIAKAEKFPDLPSSSWKPRKAGGVTQSQSKAWEPEMLMSEGRRRCMSQIQQRTNSPFLCPFVYSGPQPIGCCHPHWCDFTQSSASNVNLFQQHLPTHPEIMSYPLSRHPFTQSVWIIKLAIPRQEGQEGLIEVIGLLLFSADGLKRESELDGELQKAREKVMLSNSCSGKKEWKLSQHMLKDYQETESGEDWKS